MTTKNTTAVKKHRRTCKNKECKAKFSTTDSRKIFCCRECKENSSNTAKRSKTYEIPKTNHFFVYLTKEVQRSGSLHTLDNLVGDVEALEALYEIVKGRLIANTLSGKELFNVAHIAPSKHDYVLGLLCAENLLIAPASMNKRHTNTHANKAGVFMYRADMEIKNTILSDDTDVLDRIIDYIGLETVIAFCKKCKLLPSQRQQALKKLTKLVDPSNPEHSQYVALLADPNAKAPHLIAAIEAINGAKEYKPMMKGQRLSESAMLIKELIRHAGFRGELEDYAAIARQYTREDFSYIGLSTDAQRTLFKLLHGYLEPEMENEVDCLLYELRAPIRALDARTAAIEARVQEQAANEVKRIAYYHSSTYLWDFAQFESDFIEHVDYCLIPYMIPPLTLNLTKARYVPESGSLLPNGDIAF
ncbi:hypothetical protein [Pseudomonas guariconensis]|uniref:hypothetical protein n=1 Tax=Pseudomonas guariconensis TaxID=1288410 RepID=UPI0018A8EFAF|nr:hypothetical protein [Pseudomonas guariconensis]MBF8740225.1 hypothetical protein [Pseudomonas guariconensis]MBF8750368.1 hypothetical protein [Pseudomonas guariconensis]